MNKSHRMTPFLFLSQKNLWQLTLDYTPPAPWLAMELWIFHYQACPISTTNLVRFLFDSHAYLPAVAQTRPTDSDKGLMLAASANLITKSTPTFVMEIGQAWQWNIPRLPAYTQSVHAPVLTRPLGSNKHPHSLAVCPSLRNARYVVTGQTTIHDGHSTFP